MRCESAALQRQFGVITTLEAYISVSCLRPAWRVYDQPYLPFMLELLLFGDVPVDQVQSASHLRHIQCNNTQTGA